MKTFKKKFDIQVTNLISNQEEKLIDCIEK
jgi:3-dehydroquinate dehydratase